jgi:hypothetical protein
MSAFTDSGSREYIIGTNTMNANATTDSDRQPQSGNSQTATKEPTIAPSEDPLSITPL